MAWIESHQELGAHPKTQKLSRILDISRPAAVGHLQFLWWWAMDYAPDGDLSRFEDLDIAIGGEWDGDPDEFVQALIRAGFVDRTEGGRVIHDWDMYAGRLLDKREKDAERKRQSRNVQRTSGGRDADIRETAHVTVPNLTKPNLTVPETPPPTPALEELDVESPDKPAVRVSYPGDFEVFWSEYPSGNGSKKAAFVQWRRLKPDETLRMEIMHGLALWQRSDRWQRGFVKDAARWLRDELWRNPPPAAGPRPTNVTASTTKTGRSMAAIDRVFDQLEAAGQRVPVGREA